MTRSVGDGRDGTRNAVYIREKGINNFLSPRTSSIENGKESTNQAPTTKINTPRHRRSTVNKSNDINNARDGAEDTTNDIKSMC